VSLEFACAMVEEWAGKLVGEPAVVDLGLVGVPLFTLAWPIGRSCPSCQLSRRARRRRSGECLEGAFTLTSLKSLVSHHFTFLVMSKSLDSRRPGSRARSTRWVIGRPDLPHFGGEVLDSGDVRCLLFQRAVLVLRHADIAGHCWMDALMSFVIWLMLAWWVRLLLARLGVLAWWPWTCPSGAHQGPGSSSWSDLWGAELYIPAISARIWAVESLRVGTWWRVQMSRARMRSSLRHPHLGDNHCSWI